MVAAWTVRLPQSQSTYAALIRLSEGFLVQAGPIGYFPNSNNRVHKAGKRSVVLIGDAGRGI